MSRKNENGISNLEYHVLLALVSRPLHGYAIKDAILEESAGTLRPPAGSLYRVIARLMGSALVVETDADPAVPVHPGLARRYYALTPNGKSILAAEARRLKLTAEVAERRLGMLEETS